MKFMIIAILMLAVGFLLGYFKELMDLPLWTSLALTWMLACLFLGTWICRLPGTGSG